MNQIPTLGDCIAYGLEIGLPQVEAEKFYYYNDCRDWTMPRGQKIKKYKSAMQVWKRNAILYGTLSKPQNTTQTASMREQLRYMEEGPQKEALRLQIRQMEGQ